MARIRELSPHVADLIAAGEVVERPASVMKELLENAIDAGAAKLTAEIENGGITYLRVADDGSGIEKDDVLTAFLRHATSKLLKPEDLSSIRTLGFRGEALAAIAAVSKVELFTKNASDESGSHVKISGGSVSEHTEAGCPQGTTIVVRDLFYNTPARMKFLKKDATEGGYVSEAVEHIALSKPEISVKFIKDGKVLFHTPGDGLLRSAVYCVYGTEFAGSLIGLSYAMDGIEVSGFSSKPAASRGNRAMQIFFVNGRHVKSKLLQAALEQAYKNRLLTGRFPSCVLNLKVPFSSVDVNVHPAKTEVKFAQERRVFEVVYSAVKTALDGFSDRPEISLGEAARPLPPDREAVSSGALSGKAPAPYINPQPSSKGYVPKIITAPEQGEILALHEPKVYAYPVPDRLFTEFAGADTPTARTTADIIPPAPTLPDAKTLPPEPAEEDGGASQQALFGESFRLAGEIFNTYILVEDSDGLLIIDKHAAHERMIFDKLKGGELETSPQLLLKPEVLNVSRLEAEIIREHMPEFSKLGFDIGEFGENSFIVRQVPPFIDPGDTEALIGELVKKIRDSERFGLSMFDELINSISCKAAVKAKSRMQPDELLEIAKRVTSTPSLQFCPHGRPVAVRLTKSELEKQFFRIV